jgi:hypothetical protein
VIQQFWIEANGWWGPYLRCNPVRGPSGSPDLSAPFRCSYGNQERAGCACPSTGRSNRTVGVELRRSMFGGYWYSTPTAGECAPGARLGANGCTWRVIAQPKTIDDRGCMTARMTAPLIKHNKACFAALPKQPPDPTSYGYGVCFREAIHGVNTSRGGLAPILPAVLLAAWEKAFSSDSSADGGCPNIK